MRLALLCVVAITLVLPTDARAGGRVDWSDYIDKDGTAPLPKSTTPEVAVADDADEAPAPAKTTATKRVAKSTKATKASKAKRAKAAKAKARAKKSRRK